MNGNFQLLEEATNHASQGAYATGNLLDRSDYMKRIAIIFDNRARPETTGLYCYRALEELMQTGQLLEVKHFLPDHCDGIPANHFDLFLFVDDGMQSQIPQHLRPAAWWAIDTHLNYERTLSMARDADWSFAAQRPGVERLLSNGITNTVWLPLACDPVIHGKRPADIQFDLSFIGTRFVGEREILLNQIQDRYSNIFIGNKYFEEMAQTYSASRIVFNRSLADDINMRVFEGLCSGTLLLTNDLPEAGQEDLFQEGVHLAAYSQAQDLWEKIEYYLKHDQQRCQIAEQGRLEVLRAHTYRHRMETILSTISSQGSQHAQISSVRLEPGNSSTKSRPAIASKVVDYFEYSRPDVLELIPQTAQRILDIGCGGGHLGLTIKNRQQAYVAGVEYDAVVAERACTRLDEVQVGDIEAGEIDFPESSFDCIICADVLEHLRNPLLVLKQLRPWLKTGGKLVTSLPNVRNHTVIQSLLAGNWTYESAGLLDSDHVRFFTRREIEKLLFRAGFTIEQSRMVGNEGFEEWIEQGRPAAISLGGLQLQTSSQDEAVDFFAYQYLTRSTLTRTPAYGTTRIILVTYNQLAYTQKCLESIFARTLVPFELIVVDNGSSDGTVEYLRSLAHVRVIENKQNRGFPAAVNQGIEIATGDAILLLNNDTIVTTGWLDRLRTALDSDERIQVIGPLTNCTAGLQRIAAKYSLENLDDFAWDQRVSNRDQLELVPEVTGFCMLIDRKAIQSIGLFDEQFGTGLYEDVDYCKRVRDAGYQIAIAHDVFIHHFGHKSFQKAGIDQSDLVVINQEKFHDKWKLAMQAGTKTPASTDPFQYHSPRALGWDDGLKNQRRILELFSDQLHQVLVFATEQPDLIFCNELQNNFGCDVTICTTNQFNAGEFKSLPIAELEYHANRFDAVVCIRFDQHRESQQLLGLIHETLVPGGEFFLSVPNSRSATNVQNLISGTWSSETWNSSMRFYTRRELEKLLHSKYFSINSWNPIFSAQHGEWVAQGRPQNLNYESFRFQTDNQFEIEEFLTDEFVVSAKKVTIRNHELTSIVIVTHNQLSYTQKCLDSLKMRTLEPIEIIVVDNASTDGTASYISSLADIRLISNRDNKGFPAAANQGVEVATGKNILLLNNDTIVTTGWLQRMLNRLHSEEQIGLVGPVSNNVSGPQQIATSYRYLNELDGFAWDRGKQYEGKSVEADRLVGFCLLFKREVIERIGLLDERFGIGNFEDDDFCRRAKQAGYQSLIALDSFVHHFGSVSFQGAGVDLNQVLQENQKLYREKWEGADSQAQTNMPFVESVQDSLTPGKRRPEFTLESTSEGLKLQPNTIRLSACLIVRDNENTIRPCLESIKSWVDEIVVVDTGSNDQTAQICEELGAQVFYWPWRDDFSAARNESIDHARGEWIFWMDSDDTIPEHCGKQLRKLVDEDHAENILGYVAQVHCPGADSNDVTVVDHVKLFRNRPDLRFEFRIHEQIIPAIRRASGEVAWSDIYVVHSGSDQTEKGRTEKLVRDFRLLEKELADRPDHPFVLFNLGMTHADAKQYESAVEHLKHCIDVTGPGESHLCKAYALLVNALSHLNRNEQAWDIVIDGLKLFPDDKELMFRQALLQHHFGDFNDAEQTYLRILSEESDRKFSSVDQGISNFKARHNLAVVYEDAGKPQKAEQQWRMITEQYPDYLPAWRGLGESLLNREKNEELLKAIQSLPEKEEFDLIQNYFRGKQAIQSQEFEQARKYFEAAIRIEPNDVSILNELCRLHFELGNPIDSQQYLQKLISINPEDPSAHTNMGIVLMAQQKYEAAAEAFETSLIHRPDHQDVMQHLTRCHDHAT